MNRHNLFSRPQFLRCAFPSFFILAFLLLATVATHAQVLPSASTLPKRTLPLDISQWAVELSAAPLELSKSKALLLDLPMPGGDTRAFRIMESPIMAPDFAAAYPTFKTYSVQAVDDPAVTGRISITPFGLNGVILSREGMVLIRPLDLLNPVLHEVSLTNLSAEGFICDTYQDFSSFGKESGGAKMMTATNGATKRTYSMAIVCTGEFHNANGGTVPAASAVVVTSVNNIQAIYDRELAVNFLLSTPFIYTNPATDPFNPGLDRTLEAAQAVELNFPGGNYDVGHVFHETNSGGLGGGGVAFLNAVCNNNPLGTGFFKAGGWSGSFNNTSASWIALAAHEFGHMFGMPHTFNGTGDNCTTNIDPDNSYEIASGNSLMSYNGICGAGQNIPDGGLADDYFHISSLEKAVNHMNAQSCHTATATGNMPPVVNANPCGGTYTIPKSTPFRLTGSGTDGNGDQIYYSWEQYDEDGAGVTPTQGFIGAAAAGSSIAPLFRSYPATTSSTRTFPLMSLVAANSYTSDFEPLPSVARTLNFRLTGRDWRAGGGGIHCSPLVVTVSNSGPLSMTAPNGGETIAAGANTTVTWSVNGTNTFSTNVNIRLSIDGGLTFPYMLLGATPNDGSQSVPIPAGVPGTTTARIMVESADNVCVVFFDISNANFTVTSACAAASSNICPAAAVTFAAGNAGLNLGLNKYYGSAITQHTFTITGGSPTGPLANATTPGGLTCQTAWGTEKYATLDFAVGTTGSYTFTNPNPAPGGGEFIFSIFTSAGYNPAAPCSSTFLGSNANGAIGWSSSFTVSLTACTTYKVVMWTLNAANGSATLNISGAGTLYSSGTVPANYSYTYVAVNTTNSQVTAVNATSDFTALAAGSYNVYGASYYSGAGPTPPTVNPATWIGQTIEAILSGGACALFSSNFKPVTVTGGGGCTAPTVNAPTVTHPTCPTSNGIIVVNATGGGTLEYSINSGLNWQASATFNSLASGNYNIVVRLQANPTCFANYGANPVVLNGPPVVNAPTVTQPSCVVPTGTIVVNATGGGTLEYTVNGGTNWQTSATFSGLAPGNYTVQARLQASPTCLTAYAMNPVVLNAVNTDPCICNTYCTAGQTTGTCAGGDEHFTNVTFNTINNTSTCASSLPSGYTNYTNLSTTVSIGTSYTLNATNGGPFSGDQCKAWFDWNADGDFTDAGEEFSLTGSGSSNAQFWTVSVLVPAGATPGSTRMRVRVTYDTGMAPCGTSQYGETEDYCITISGGGCTPPVVNAPTVTQPTCAVTTGTIVVNATGGGTLEYSKDNGTNWQASATFSSLTPGNYTIKVRLQANPTCMTAYASNPVVINAVPSAPVVNAPTVTQPTCAVPTGTIVVNATGSGTLEYSKDNGTNWQASATFSSLTPGNYTIKVRLQANPTCMTAYASNPVVINAAPGAPVVNAPTVTQPTCAVTTGTIVVNATGSGTLEYSKDNGTNWQTSATFSSLTPGNYTLVVRLQSNPTCMTAYASNPVVINAVPSAPVVNAPTVTQPTCAVTSGTIVVNATGSGTLEYSKDNGTNWQASATFSSLTPGNYTIKVRLQANPTCMTAYASNPVVINAVPTAPNVTAPTVTQPPSCAVQTGIIVVNATGSGTLEYSVDNGSNWQLSPTFSGLVAGNYTLVVRLQANPTCMTAYASNPVVLVAPVGCCNTPTYTNPCTSNDYIDNFIFGTFSNLGTGCGNPGANNLSNYLGTGPNVQVAETYSVTIKAGVEPQYYGVYIDFNQNGSYLDAGEFFNIGQALSNATVTANVIIPSGITVGTRTMRVRSNYFDALTAADGCNTNLAYGEIEDYNIYIFCPNNLAVNAVPIPAGTYDADLQLSSSGTVNNGTSVLFRAANLVELLPNFEVQAGGLLEISMQGCY